MRCPVCNQVIGGITPAHVKKHGYTNTQEFFKDYPDFKIDVDRLHQAYNKRSKRNFDYNLKKGGIQS